MNISNRDLENIVREVILEEKLRIVNKKLSNLNEQVGIDSEVVNNPEFIAKVRSNLESILDDNLHFFHTLESQDGHAVIEHDGVNYTLKVFIGSDKFGNTEVQEIEVTGPNGEYDYFEHDVFNFDFEAYVDRWEEESDPGEEMSSAEFARWSNPSMFKK